MKRRFIVLGMICTLTTAFFLLSSTTGAPTTSDVTTSKPSKLITIEKANSLFTNYQSSRSALIEAHERNVNQASDFTALQYVEWDIETIENYLDYVKQEAGKANIDVATVRIYLGQYGADHNNEDTMFWVPTTEIDGKNRGFYIEENKAKPIYENDKAGTISAEQESLIMNFGHCCPPNTDFHIKPIAL
ncbi:MAG: hypothetical protein HRT65_12380 [Flavobacteriaceae bacterium]|nr:hypothetical protein [Flavobacteriaceae bacterium]